MREKWREKAWRTYRGKADLESMAAISQAWCVSAELNIFISKKNICTNTCL